MSLFTQHSVTLSVSLVDTDGAPTGSSKLYGQVRNEYGTLVDTININQLVESPLGTYTYDSYSIDDYTKIFGSSFTVTWFTCNDNIVPTESVQTYRIYGQHNMPYKHRLIIWAPTYVKKLYGYQVTVNKMSAVAALQKEEYENLLAIYNEALANNEDPGEEPTLPDTVTYPLMGEEVFTYFTKHPWLLDPTVYEYPMLAEGSIISVNTLLWSPGQVGPVPGPACSDIHVQPLMNDVCVITGNLKLASGIPPDVNRVTFFVDANDGLPSFDQSLIATDRSISVAVHPSGEFAVPLIQGLTVIIDIPETRFRRKFTVPAQASANILDIPTEPVSFRYRY